MNDWPVKSWPALLVGLILATYWLRVLRMVWRNKRRAGHDAGLIPKEQTGRRTRILWVPVVGLWIILPLVAAFGGLSELWMFRPLKHWPIVQWAALAVAIGAFVLTWICWKNMGKSWRMGIDPGEKAPLVFTGPFAYVRHPIYALSQTLVVMTALIVPSPLMILVAGIHMSLMQWEARREEAHLVTKHGQAYDDYRRRVWRFLPRSLKPYRA